MSPSGGTPPSQTQTAHLCSWLVRSPPSCRGDRERGSHWLSSSRNNSPPKSKSRSSSGIQNPALRWLQPSGNPSGHRQGPQRCPGNITDRWGFCARAQGTLDRSRLSKTETNRNKQNPDYGTARARGANAPTTPTARYQGDTPECGVGKGCARSAFVPGKARAPPPLRLPYPTHTHPSRGSVSSFVS